MDTSSLTVTTIYSVSLVSSSNVYINRWICYDILFYIHIISELYFDIQQFFWIMMYI